MSFAPITSFNMGVKVSGNVQSCLQQADLDYQVASTPVLFKSTEQNIDPVPKRYVTYRTDTCEPFGVVGSKYRIIQNDTLFAFLDLVPDLKITNGGHLKAGGWLCGRFPDQEVMGDVFSPYVFFKNAHDGTSQFVVAFTPYRIRSHSFLNLNDGASYHFHVRHTNIAEQRIKTAQEFVKSSVLAMDDFRVMVENTSKKQFTLDQVKQIFGIILLPKVKTVKMPATYEFDQQALLDCYFNAENSRFVGTGYGILLAVSMFVTDVLGQRARTDESFLQRSLFRTHPMLQDAYKFVMQ